MFEPLIPELDVPVVFRQRPLSVPGDLRPAWRISVILLLLRKCCRQGRSSLRRLHVLGWAIKDEQVANALVRAIGGEVPPGTVLVRIEPALNRAVDFARGHGLIQRQSSDRIELTPDGKAFADSIIDDPLVLGFEKQFVEKIRFSVTEEFVTRMFDPGGAA